MTMGPGAATHFVPDHGQHHHAGVNLPPMIPAQPGADTSAADRSRQPHRHDHRGRHHRHTSDGGSKSHDARSGLTNVSSVEEVSKYILSRLEFEKMDDLVEKLINDLDTKRFSSVFNKLPMHLRMAAWLPPPAWRCP